MKKRLLLVLFIFLLFIASVSAFDAKIDKYYFVKDTFKVDSDLLLIAGADNDYNELFLTLNDDETFIIDNGTCEETEFYKYCFMGNKLDYMDYGRQLPNSFDWEPSLHMIVYSKAPKVKVAISAPSEINQDDKATVRVTITNTGELAIQDLELPLLISENVTATSSSNGVSITNSAVTWRSSYLASGDDISFTFQLSPDDFKQMSIPKSNLKYYYSDKEFYEKVDSKIIKLNSPYKLTSSISSSRFEIGEEIVLNWKIVNEDWEDNLNVNLEYVIPQSLQLVSVSSGVGKSNIISREFNLKPNEAQEFKIVLKSYKSGSFEIYESTNINIRSDTFIESKKYSANITVSDLIAVLSSSKKEIFEDVGFTISSFVDNPSLVSYYDIEGKITIPFLGNYSFEFDKIDSGEKLDLFNKVFYAPAIENQSLVTAVLNGSYLDSANRIRYFSDTASFTLIPYIFNVIPSKSFSDEKLLFGENLTVTVSAKNAGSSLVYVTLKERLPLGVKVKSGLTKNEISLNVGKSQDFFIYKLSFDEPGNYSLITDVIYDGEVVSSINKTISVKKVAKLENVSVEVVDKPISNPVNKTIIKEEKSDKSFSTLVKSIVGFFVNLFR